ncbi:MAG TPA: hypothetical protein VF043_01660, partial [Ktedonobacteraceae bacterium]
MERARSSCGERWRAELTHDVACQPAPQMLPRRLSGGDGERVPHHANREALGKAAEPQPFTTKSSCGRAKIAVKPY